MMHHCAFLSNAWCLFSHLFSVQKCQKNRTLCLFLNASGWKPKCLLNSTSVWVSVISSCTWLHLRKNVSKIIYHHHTVLTPAIEITAMAAPSCWWYTNECEDWSLVTGLCPVTGLYDDPLLPWCVRRLGNQFGWNLSEFSIGLLLSHLLTQSGSMLFLHANHANHNNMQKLKETKCVIIVLLPSLLSVYAAWLELPRLDSWLFFMPCAGQTFPFWSRGMINSDQILRFTLLLY